MAAGAVGRMLMAAVLVTIAGCSAEAEGPTAGASSATTHSSVALTPSTVLPDGAIDPQFWQLIDTLGGSIGPENAGALAARLLAAGPRTTARFADGLQKALAALDTGDHAQRRVTDRSSGVGPVTMSDDLFLYARCAVIAQGEATWSRVAADPAAMSEDRRVFDGEWLLTVAPEPPGQPVDRSQDPVAPSSSRTRGITPAP